MLLNFTYDYQNQYIKAQECRQDYIFCLVICNVVDCLDCLQYNDRYGDVKSGDISLEGQKVSFTDACTEPETMMVEPSDTAFADMAVHSTRWSKDVTTVAKLNSLCKDRSGREFSLVDHQVKQLVFVFDESICKVEEWHIFILFSFGTLLHFRNYTWFGASSQHHRCIAGNYQQNDYKYIEVLDFVLNKEK